MPSPTLDGLRVRDVMRIGLIICRPETPAIDAAQRMIDENVRALAVLNQAGGLAGFITQIDIVQATLADQATGAVTASSVAELMTRDVPTIDEDAPLSIAATRILEPRVQRLIVTQGTSRTPVGIITLTDLMRHAAGGR